MLYLIINESGIIQICVNTYVYIHSEHKKYSKSQNKMNQFSEFFATNAKLTS